MSHSSFYNKLQSVRGELLNLNSSILIFEEEYLKEYLTKTELSENFQSASNSTLNFSGQQ